MSKSDLEKQVDRMYRSVPTTRSPIAQHVPPLGSRRFGRGVRRVPGTMNKTEAAYAEELRLRELAGEVVWFKYEGVTLRLGPDCRYTPDFLVMLLGGELECHETKGFHREDAMVKLRVAAEAFPFRFILVEKLAQKNGGGFSYKTIGA